MEAALRPRTWSNIRMLNLFIVNPRMKRESGVDHCELDPFTLWITTSGTSSLEGM